MDRDQVLAVMRNNASELLAVPPQDMREDASIVSDFGLDSLDVLEYLFVVEDELGVQVPDEDYVGVENIGQLADLLYTHVIEASSGAAVNSARDRESDVLGPSAAG